jgi:hypothetical protein
MLPHVFAHAEDMNRVGCVHSVDQIKSLDCLLKPPVTIRLFFLEQIIFFYFLHKVDNLCQCETDISN